MGVAGSGKSTVAAELASQAGAEFRDGDAQHPAANLDKMRRGVPLTDDDRAPWLEAVGRWLADGVGPRVTSCSALRESYRDILRRACPGVVFLYLEVTPDTARERLAARTDHFMPASLLASQFTTLEEPLNEPDVVLVD
ncbi:MAG: gluconokinase, partial [Actinobacteria bacterium]|nr:gluconokinase [Actinomycetota bacterium]